MNEIQELRYLILALQREGNRQFAADLRPLGLTPSQAEAISLLAAHQPLSLNGVGELLICESGSNPSRIIDRLVVTGLVQREPDPDDRRQVVLALTSQGDDMARRVADVEKRLEWRLEELVGSQRSGPALALLRHLAAQLPAADALRRRGIMSSPSLSR